MDGVDVKEGRDVLYKRIIGLRGKYYLSCVFVRVNKPYVMKPKYDLYTGKWK
jgi:hypothetical protein